MKTIAPLTKYNKPWPLPAFTRREAAPSSRALLAAVLLLGSGLAESSRASSFPTAPQDEQNQFSIAVMRILVASKFQPMFDGTHGSPYYGYTSSGRFTSPLLFDNKTWIGLSAAHCEQVSTSSSLWPAGPGTWPANPGVICSATAPFNSGGLTPATASYSEFTGTPFGFGFPGTGYNEVFTYMINLQLTCFSNCYDPTIVQVPPPYDMIDPVVYTGPQHYPLIHKTIGRMISSTAPGCTGTTPTGAFNDYSATSPAKSFFDVFINAFIPPGPGTDIPAGLYLYNDPADPNLGPQPLIIENYDVETLPPLPLYEHGGSLYAVPIKMLNAGQDVSGSITWNAGEILGMLTLAGHELGLTCGSGPAVHLFVNNTLGPPGQANPEPPALWVFPDSLFPSANTSYRSVAGTNVGGGSIDQVTFTVPNVGSVYARSFSHSDLSSPINRPPVNGSDTYTMSSSTVTLELSLDGTSFSTASGSGPISLTISNTGTTGNATLYDTAITDMTNICSGPFGSFLLRSSLTKTSPGRDTVISSSQGPYIASYFDVSYELSTDAGNTWVAADRPIRLLVGEPVCGVPGNKLHVKLSGSSVILSWSGQNYTLQGSTSLSGPWSSIAGASPVTRSIIGSAHYFRLVCP